MNKKKARIAVVMGGQSSEHEVSLKSGAMVLQAIEDRNPLPVVIGRDGRWQIDGVLHASVGSAIEDLESRADVVFLALHGERGEDGTIQGLLEIVGLPYTGSGVLASALAMDKVRTKQIYAQHELPTPDFVLVERADLAGELAISLPCPVVVKPNAAGSSVGVSFVSSPENLRPTLEDLLSRHSTALVEKAIVGREFTCGVLEDQRGAFPLPVTEIIPDAARFHFFDYAAKYTPGGTLEVTPAQIEPGVYQRIQALAVRAHLVIGCRDMSRSDMLLSEQGALFLLETNTIPGLTETSLLPQAAAEHGLSFRALVDVLLARALARHPREDQFERLA